MQVDLSQYVTTKEAAEITGMHRRYIRKLVLTGRLKSVQFGRSYLISRHSAKAFQRDEKGRGRPKGVVSKKVAKKAKPKPKA